MPPDKAILEELKVLSNEDSIPTKQMQRLILAAVVELSDKLDGLKSTQEQCASAIVESLKPIKKNLMFQIGDFITAHPKTTVSIIVFALFMSNLWFIDEIRYNVLLWLKVPEEIIKLLVHGG